MKRGLEIDAGGRWTKPLRIGVAAIVAAAALLALSACGAAPSSPAGEFEPSKPGVLTVATDRLPQPGFWDGDAGAVPEGGFEFGLAEVLADRFGLDRVDVVEIPFEELVAGELGGADLAMAQITPTSERGSHLDFSEPYMSANPAALVASGVDVPDVMRARELKWAVEEGTTLAETLGSVIIPKREPRKTPTQAAAVAAVESGKADAALLDLPVALAIAERSGGALEVAAQIPAREALAAALPKGSTNREALDAAIRAFISDGTIGELASEWLGVPMHGSRFTVQDVPALRTN